MGKAAIAGIVIALVAGTVLGYFVIPFLFPTQADTPTEIYYDYDNTSTPIMDAGGVVLTNLYISFTVEQEVVAYCDFRAMISLVGDAEGSSPEQVIARFIIDGVVKNSPIGVVEVTDGIIPDGEHLGLYLTLQASFTLSAGAHNVTIQLDPFISIAHTALYKTLSVTPIPA